MMIDAMTARTIAEGKVAVAMIAVPVPSETPPGSSRPAKPVGELVRVQSPSVSNSRDAALLSSAPPGKDAAQVGHVPADLRVRSPCVAHHWQPEQPGEQSFGASDLDTDTGWWSHISAEADLSFVESLADDSDSFEWCPFDAAMSFPSETDSSLDDSTGETVADGDYQWSGAIDDGLAEKPTAVCSETKSLTWCEALHILEQHEADEACPKLLTRPPRLCEIPADECMFLEMGSTIRRAQGHDLWKLAGSKRRPKTNPRVICSYGKVICATSGATIGRATSYELLQPSDGRSARATKARLYCVQRDGSYGGNSIAGPERGTDIEDGSIGQTDSKTSRDNDSRRPLTMEEAEQTLHRLISGSQQTADTAVRIESRPAVLPFAKGQLYFENPPKRRCLATLGMGVARDSWRAAGGRKGAHVYPKSEHGPPSAAPAKASNAYAEPLLCCAVLCCIIRIRRQYGAVINANGEQVARYARYTLLTAICAVTIESDIAKTQCEGGQPMLWQVLAPNAAAFARTQSKRKSTVRVANQKSAESMQPKRRCTSTVSAAALSLTILLIFAWIKLVPFAKEQESIRQCNAGEYDPIDQAGCRPCGHCAVGDPAVELCGGRTPGWCMVADKALDVTSGDDSVDWKSLMYAMPVPPPPLRAGVRTFDDIVNATPLHLLDDPSSWAGATLCEQRLAKSRNICCKGVQHATAVGCSSSTGNFSQSNSTWLDSPLGLLQCPRECHDAFADFTADCASLALLLATSHTSSRQDVNIATEAVASFASTGNRCGMDGSWLRRPAYGYIQTNDANYRQANLHGRGYDPQLFQYCYNELESTVRDGCLSVTPVGQTLMSLMMRDSASGPVDHAEAALLADKLHKDIAARGVTCTRACAPQFARYYRVCQPVVVAALRIIFGENAAGTRMLDCLADWTTSMDNISVECDKVDLEHRSGLSSLVSGAMDVSMQSLDF